MLLFAQQEATSVDWTNFLVTLAATLVGGIGAIIGSYLFHRMKRWEPYAKDFWNQSKLTYSELAAAGYLFLRKLQDLKTILTTPGINQDIYDAEYQKFETANNDLNIVVYRALILCDGNLFEKVNGFNKLTAQIYDQVGGQELDSIPFDEAKKSLSAIIIAVREELKTDQHQQNISKLFK